METPVAHTPASLRARLGLSQREVAEAASAIAQKTDPGAGVSTNTVTRLERGLRIGLDHAEAIAAVLGVSVDVLIAAIRTESGLRAARPGKRRSVRRRVA